MSAPTQGEGRVVLITGASRGLGRALALALAGDGVRLVLTAKNRGALEEVDDALRAQGREATLAPLDLAKPEMIAGLFVAIRERFGRLDGLAHLAAHLGQLTPAHQIAPELLKALIAINVTATQQVIAGAHDLLRLSDAPRAAFATCSSAGAYFGGYAASKAAADALVLAWAKETRALGFRVNLYDPGPMATRLRSQAFPGEPEGLQADPASRVAPLLALLDPACDRAGERVLFEQRR